MEREKAGIVYSRYRKEKPIKKARAKELRRIQTPAEEMVWDWLKGRALLGLKWRRQHVVAGFILDFYCAEHRLALELDGEIHDSQKDYDLARDTVLATYGITVLRVQNQQAHRESLEEFLRDMLASRGADPRPTAPSSSSSPAAVAATPSPSQEKG